MFEIYYVCFMMSHITKNACNGRIRKTRQSRRLKTRQVWWYGL